MHITELEGAFGAEVADVDLSEELTAPDARRLVDALHAHRILVIPGQRLSNGEYARFGELWGDPIEFFAPGARDRELPSLIRISNSPKTPQSARDGAMHWHSDSSYEAVPASVTMLLGVEAPVAGNDTLFADCVAAYDALDDGTKARIDRLVVVHDPSGGKVDLDGEVRGTGTTTSLPTVTHPLVTAHPVTGRRSLFGFSGTAAGIVGWDEGEALALLFELKAHVLQPRFRQTARVAAGTILVWDNFAVVHSATPTVYSDAEGERRLLLRISTRGLPAPYRADA